jgi:uncharacterized phage-associated protein
MGAVLPFRRWMADGPWYSIKAMFHFDEAKATQAAAYFLRLRGGRMHYLKLLKLLYLADRTALLEWGHPITTDRYVSMDHGPVVSNIYNLIVEDKKKPVWSQFISPPLGDYEVELKKEAPADRLSRAEERLIEQVHQQYGHWNRWRLVDFLHTLPEWRDPHGSSLPIQIRDILKAGGEEDEEIRAVVRELHGMRAAEDTFKQLH